MQVAAAFGLTVSIPKTKLMVIGHDITEEEKAAIPVGSKGIEHVEYFSYLGLLITITAQMDPDVDRRIANVSKALEPHVGLFSKTNISALRLRERYTRPALCLFYCMRLNVGHHFTDI